MTVMVFTFVLMLGNALREILPLVVSGQVSFNTVGEAIGLLVPWVWVFALPMGMLTATLLIFGRFSADQELTAVRAGGISLLAVASPILLLSVALCGVSAFVNMEVGPRCRVAYTTMISTVRAELSKVYLPEGAFISLSGYIFHIGKNRKGDLEDVTIYTLKNQTNVEYMVRAPKGKMEVDSANNQLKIILYDYTTIPISGAQVLGYGAELPLTIELENTKKASTPKIDDMTFTQLWAELHSFDRLSSLPFSVKKLSPEQREAKRRWERERREFISRVQFHLNRQVAFSFACFGFTLVGIPLSIRVHRRETNIGIAIALALVALYYSFILIGQSLNTRPELFPQLIVWVPNFLFQSVGAVMLWRANRGE